jgi:hypothetical protein
LRKSPCRDQRRSPCEQALQRQFFAIVSTASIPAWTQGGGGGGGGAGGGGAGGGNASGGSAGGSSLSGAEGNGAGGSAVGRSNNPVSRENGFNDNKGVPSPSTTNYSSSSPSYGQSPSGAVTTKSLSSTSTGVMVNPNAKPPSSDNGNASVAPAGRVGGRTPSRDAR